MCPNRLEFNVYIMNSRTPDTKLSGHVFDIPSNCPVFSVNRTIRKFSSIDGPHHKLLCTWVFIFGLSLSNDYRVNAPTLKPHDLHLPNFAEMFATMSCCAPWVFGWSLPSNYGVTAPDSKILCHTYLRNRMKYTHQTSQKWSPP